MAHDEQSDIYPETASGAQEQWRPRALDQLRSTEVCEKALRRILVGMIQFSEHRIG